MKLFMCDVGNESMIKFSIVQIASNYKKRVDLCLFEIAHRKFGNVQHFVPSGFSFSIYFLRLFSIMVKTVDNTKGFIFPRESVTPDSNCLAVTQELV